MAISLPAVSYEGGAMTDSMDRLTSSEAAGSDYRWIRAHRGRLWHIAKHDDTPPHISPPIPLCTFGLSSWSWWSEMKPLVFGTQDPPIRGCMACVDKLLRKEQR